MLPSGKAPASQAGIRGFDPRHPLHIVVYRGPQGEDPLILRDLLRAFGSCFFYRVTLAQIFVAYV